MVYQDEKISNLLNCSKLQIALEMQLKIQGEKMELLNAFSYLGRPQCLGPGTVCNLELCFMHQTGTIISV